MTLQRVALGLLLLLAPACDDSPPGGLADLASPRDDAPAPPPDLADAPLACPGAGYHKLIDGNDGPASDENIVIAGDEYAALWSVTTQQQREARFVRVARDGKLLLGPVTVPGLRGRLLRTAAGYGVLDCESAAPGAALTPLSPLGQVLGPPGPAPAGALCPDGVSAGHRGQRARVALVAGQVLLSRYTADGAPLGAPLQLAAAPPDQYLGGLRLAAGPVVDTYGVVYHQPDPQNARRVDLRFCAVAADGSAACRVLLASFAWHRQSPALVTMPDGYALAVADSAGLASGYNTRILVYLLSPRGEILRHRVVTEARPVELLRLAWDGEPGRLLLLWESRWHEAAGPQRAAVSLAPCLAL